MRWWGLYTQRKPGIDGGRTGSLEPHELDDEYFMLRVRSDGGILTPDQLRAIADVSQTYARDTADITDRQNVQLHWIRIEDVPAIWEQLEAVGLTHQRGVRRHPARRPRLPGRRRRRRRDHRRHAGDRARSSRRYVGDPRFSNLPRKFKTAVSGSPRQDVAHEINDISFVGVVHPEHGPGFDVWVGGGLSTNPMLAQRLGVWVPLDEVPDVWEAVISVFRDYGYRRLRTRARLKFLVTDWGAAKFREVLETEYLKRPLLDGPAAPASTGRRDHVGVHDQQDGRKYVGAAPTVGRVSGTILHRIADLADAARLGPGAAHRAAEAGRPRRRGRARSSRSSRRCTTLGLEVRPERVPPRHDGLHRHRVLQARDRRDQGQRGEARRRARGPAADLRRTRSRSTSTAARTRAPASRSPTSASRACS